MLNFQEMIATLLQFWTEQGCLVHQGYDLEVGAGTFNPATFLRALGPEPYSAVYVEPSRRPQDGRYGDNPNRVQFYHQMQVILKPSPANIQELYLESLKRIGLNLDEHDIRFVHDDWENPTIGAWGLGWEIWLDGMEVTQFTYFQAVGGVPVKPVSGEITYGLERLAMYLQGVDSFFDLKWNDKVTYGDVFKRSEWEWSHHNFHEANTSIWLRHFDDFEAEALRLLKRNFPIPAYDYVMKASHAFNILDARGAISVTERTGYIGRIRNLARSVAEGFLKSREEQKWPLLKEAPASKEPLKIATVDSPYNPLEKEDFLLEIGSEELPATFIPLGMQALEKAIRKLLHDNALSFETLEVFGTPRRLSVYVKGLASGTQSQKLEKKGPPLKAAFDSQGNPTEVGAGFCRSLGLEPSPLATLSGIEVRAVKDVDYLFATIEKPGISTRSLLASTLASLILSLDFPKKMRWGSFDVEYARPLRWFVCLYGTHVIPFTICDVTSGSTSYGHRQLAPVSFTIAHPRDYLTTLEKHFVLADCAKRRAVITTGLQKIEKEKQVQVVDLEKVMNQVLYLVEWPFVTVGNFNPSYLKAPKEILISEMIEHQKYFPLAAPNGALVPHFAICCNNTPSDKIRHGNEKALSPRLADGLFLYEEDLKVPLKEFNEKLSKVTFQKELGTVAQKVKRLETNVEILHAFLPLCDLKKAKRAASFSKADLVSQLVGEFPELQGTAGKFFALHQGEDPEVATAIEEQWMPRGEKAPLPQTGCGTLVSISDKIDNLLSCFSLGLVPTSSSDPYALRRQVLGIIRMLLEQKKYLPLKEVFSLCFDAFINNPAKAKKEEILSQIEEFLKNRVRTVFQEGKFEKDEVEAVLSYRLYDIYDRYCLLVELHNFRKKAHAKFLSLLTVVKRAKKILPEQKPGAVKTTLLKEPSEKALYECLVSIKKSPYFNAVKPSDRDYGDVLLRLCDLEKPLATLFDSVKIMDEDPVTRETRLSLLQAVWDVCEEVVDFSKIQEH